MKMQVKFVGESSPLFIKGARYSAKLISMDDCKRVQAIQVRNATGVKVRIDGPGLQDFKVVAEG